MFTSYYDENFLLKLDKVKEKEKYARITSLSQDENPIEYIEGRITSGSINIDGTNTIRRTCSLSMVANDLNIKDYYWGLNTKFKLEIGVKNTIDNNYPEIIWFPQGLYVFSSFNTSASTGGYTISLSGKDKMCLLNGEIGGSIPHSVDFGVEEYYDKTTNTTTYTKIPVKQIIREILHMYGNEPYHNIIINDVDDYGVELLEYRGDNSTPLFMFKSDLGYENMSMNKEMPCYVQIDGKWVNKIGENDVKIGNLENLGYSYDTLTDFIQGGKWNIGTKICLNPYPENSPIKEYTVAKIGFGQTAGYRLTPLVYPSELQCNLGEAITSILDKIKSMLGDYEYFYDLEGRFIFQRTKTYLSNPWNSLVKLNEDHDLYVESVAYTSALAYTFYDNYFFTQVSNNPQLTNIKNDFSIWGARKSVSGADIPIHMRYALDYKPSEYVNYNGEKYLEPYVDWREIIYQMAIDFFKHNQEDDFLNIIANNNPKLYPTGYTGYERYYTDLQGFWRNLYYLPELAWDLDEQGNPINKEPILNAQYYIRKIDEEDPIRIEFQQIQFSDIIQIKIPPAENQYYYKDKDGNIAAYNPNISIFNEKNNYYIKDNETNTFKEINIYEYKDDNINYYIINNESQYDLNTYWNINKDLDPGKLDFWIDFIGEGSSIEKFFIPAIGDRIKTVNDNQITGIYFKDVPTVVFVTPEEWNAMGGSPIQTGYIYVRVNSSFNGFFNISSQGKTAHEEMEALLYNHTYAADTVNLTSIPIYYLQPNTRISIKDAGIGVEGEYIVTRITLPLNYNGMMQLTASKVAETIY